MLKTWKSKKKNDDETVIEEPTTNNESSKKKIKTTDMVFFGGVAMLIIGAVIFIRSNYLPKEGATVEGETDVTRTKDPDAKVTSDNNKSTTPASPPWEQQESNLEKFKPDFASPKLPKKEEKKTPPIIAQKYPFEYRCTLQDGYIHFKDKEIVYYTRIAKGQEFTYLATHHNVNWDEHGIVLTKMFHAYAVDKQNQMVEVEKDKWIPALEFAVCQKKVK